MPNRCGQRRFGINHAIGVDVLGIAAAKSLRMLHRAPHAHGAHELVYGFRKRSAQEAHTRGSAKHCDAGAGADSDAATPRQPSMLACFAQAANCNVSLFSASVGSSNDDIDASFHALKAIKRLFNDGHLLVIERILNGEYDAVHSADAMSCSVLGLSPRAVASMPSPFQSVSV